MPWECGPEPPLNSPRPSPARGASRPLSSGVQAGGPLRFLRLPPRLKAWGAPAASRGRVLALRAAGRTNPLTRHPLAEAGSAPQFWPVLRFSAGCGVKGTPGGRMRSAAEGEHRTGEDVGKAAPLTALEAIQPIGKGQVKGTRPPHLLPQPVGQEPTRDATRRGLPKRSAEQGPVVRIVVVRLLLFLRNPTFDPQWRQGDDLVELPASPSQADGDTAARSRETRCHEKETPRKRG